MTYVEHLRKGFEKARAASATNQRITQLLNDFVNEVRREPSLSGWLELQKGQRSERRGQPPIAPSRVGLVPSWLEEADELILKRPHDRLLVCLVTRSVDGFPVELTYADQVVWCRSEDDLKLGLSYMLENAKIASLLQPPEIEASK
jgi:hypothetical protein